MGLDLVSLGVAVGILSFIQLGVFSALPNKLKDIMAGVPFLGIALNWTASTIILAFTGMGTFVGMANMGASLLFAGFLYIYRRAENIKDARLVFRGIKPVIEIVHADGRIT